MFRGLSNKKGVEKRYENDAEFRTLVNMFYRLKFETKLATGEIKDAFLFALMKFEHENINSMHLPLCEERIK